MPRQGRSRGARPTRSPSAQLFSGFVFETYNHIDDLPVLSDAPKKRPRHATRGAAAAERRQESAAPLPRRSSSRSLRLDPVPMKPPPRSRDDFTKAIKHHDCTVCLRRGTIWMLLKCIRCARCVHSYCLNPPQTMQPKRGVWTCEPCARAPPPEKRRAGRAFRNAVDTFPFLVPHGYLDAMTDAVALAAAADVANNQPHKEEMQDFGPATTTDPPEPANPMENTVVLKVESDDSELDDLRPLAEIRDQVQQEAAAETNKPLSRGRERKRGTTAHLPTGAAKTRVAAGSTERGTASPEIGSAGPAQGAAAPSRASTASAAGNTDTVRSGTGRGSRRGRAPRAGRERRNGEAAKPSSSDSKIFLKLRRKPPASRCVAVSFRERAKHVMDERAKAEMCRRLAKARAKKAELRAIAIREKAASDQALMEKTTAEKATVKAEKVVSDASKGPISPIRAARKGDGSTAETPKVGLPNTINIGAAVTQIAAMQGVVTPMATTASQIKFGTAGSSRSPGPAVRNGFASPGKRAGTAGTAQNNVNSSAVNVASPAGRSVDRMTIPSRRTGSDRMPVRRHDASASPVRSVFQHGETKLSSFYPFGTGKRSTEPMEAVEIVHESPGRRTVGTDVIMKSEKHPHEGSLHGSKTHVEKETGPGDFVNSPTTPRTVGSSIRAEESRRSPSRRPLTEKECSGEVVCIDVDAVTVDDNDVIARFTPEQRTAAKMANLFQSSVRSGDSNPKAVTANWLAKNEALLTLAEKQKGSTGNRRSSAGVSSGSLDRDGSVRSAKTHHRTDNVPESEKKRMQVTAMMASGRARGTALQHNAEPAAEVTRRGSISRLLLDPSAVDSREGRNSTHESAGRGRARQGFDVDQSATIPADKPASVGDGTGVSRRGDEGTAFRSRLHRPDIVSFQSNQLGAMRTTRLDIPSGDLRTRRRSQIPSQGSQWEDVPLEYEAHRIPSRAVAIPSSHSGSQSEAGSAPLKGLTSVQTLKKPKKKKTTMATTLVTHRKLPPELEPARVVEVIDPIANEQTSVASRPGWSGAKLSGGIVTRHGHSQSSYEHEEQNSTLRPNYLEGTPDGNTRRNGAFEGQPMEPPAEPLSFKQLSRNDRHTSGNYRHTDSGQDVMRSPVAETGLSGPAESPYPNITISQGARGSCGGTQNYPDSHNTQNQMSPIRQGSQGASHSPGQGFPSPMFPGDYHRGSHEDPVRFAESRRLRRSVAPTVPTATRRFQYEQGRQLVTKHQQAYSAARRYRTKQRQSETGFQRMGADWEPSREHHGTAVQPMTSYPSYSHQRTSDNAPRLNHHVIAQEGARPQLAPVLYEPGSPLRNHTRNDMTWGASSISREAIQRTTQSFRPPVAHGYHQDYPGSAEQSSHPFSRYRPLPQSRVAATPFQRRAVFDRSGEPSRTPISRLGEDGTTELADTRREMYSRDMNNYGRTSGFLEPDVRSGEVASNTARRMGEYVDDQTVAQASQPAQPARTDPSLKNLLG